MIKVLNSNDKYFYERSLNAQNKPNTNIKVIKCTETANSLYIKKKTYVLYFMYNMQK